MEKARIGECAHCGQTIRVEAAPDGAGLRYRAAYHDWPPPSRAVCSGRNMEPRNVRFEDDSLNRHFLVTFSDGSKWSVPVAVIAEDRIQCYLEEGLDANQAYIETWELFEDTNEIADWVQNNMNWPDLEGHADRVIDPDPPDYNEEWPNVEWEVDK